MKKYSLGIFALILAIGLYSFTVSQKTTVVPSLYWYDADDGSPLYGGNPTDVIPPDCDKTVVDCAYGFSDPQDDPLNHVNQAAFIAKKD